MNNATSAYNAGIDGQPEPAKIFKHIRMVDSSGEVLEGDVETEASVRDRLAWSRGTQGPEQLFDRYVAARRAAVEELTTAKLGHDWLCSDDCDATTCQASNVDPSPASIHEVH